MQFALIGIAAVVLAVAINYPDFHHRPSQPLTLFFSLLVGVSIGLVVLGTVAAGAERKKMFSALLSTGFLWLIWVFVALFLWVNTYGE